MPEERGESPGSGSTGAEKAVLADCHLHLEGSLPEAFLRRLALRARHGYAQAGEFERARREMAGPAGFLELYAEVCRLFRTPEDCAEGAFAIAQALAADGVAYAEVYVSPEVFARVGLEPAACLAAVAEGFLRGEASGGARCRILLDVVRQWGPESAARVLDLYERHPLEEVVGFGLGGEERSQPASAFADAYLRARRLGLRTSVHAGEWAGSESVREALDALRPDRLDHGIAAAEDPRLLERLAQEQIVLWVAPTSNVRTGAVSSLASHGLPQLLEAGVRVALAADDPLLFATSTREEYRSARERLGLAPDSLRDLAANGWRGAFCPEAERERGLETLRGSDFGHRI